MYANTIKKKFKSRGDKIRGAHLMNLWLQLHECGSCGFSRKVTPLCRNLRRRPTTQDIEQYNLRFRFVRLSPRTSYCIAT